MHWRDNELGAFVLSANAFRFHSVYGHYIGGRAGLTPSLNVIQIAGAIIVAAVLIQVAVLLFSSLNRLAHDRGQQRLARKLLRYEVEIAKGVAGDVASGDHAWPGYRKFRIQRKVSECPGVCSFYLKPHDEKPLPSFKPGQYLTFALNLQGEGQSAEQKVVRCYSLSDCSNSSNQYRVTIKKAPPPGVVSGFFHDLLKEGNILDVEAPRGIFYLDMSEPRPIVLIAGGIGITPLLSMLNAVVKSGSRRETWLFLGVRNGKEYIFKEHLERIAAENENVRLHVCYSDPEEGDVEGGDHCHAGWVGVDLFKQLLPSSNYDFYICGPGPMMDAITQQLAKWGVPEASVHFESFGRASVKKKGAAPGEPEVEAGPGIEVTFAKSDKTLPWDPSIGSLLDFALSNGVVINSGCQAGNCGTCLTAVKEGEVDYLQEPGAIPEEGSCLTCISVPKADLTLEA